MDTELMDPPPADDGDDEAGDGLTDRTTQKLQKRLNAVVRIFAGPNGHK